MTQNSCNTKVHLADAGNLELTEKLINTCSTKGKLSSQHIPSGLSIFKAA